MESLLVTLIVVFAICQWAGYLIAISVIFSKTNKGVFANAVAYLFLIALIAHSIWLAIEAGD